MIILGKATVVGGLFIAFEHSVCGFIITAFPFCFVLFSSPIALCFTRSLAQRVFTFTIFV